MIKQFTINLNKGEGEVAVRIRKQERRSYILLALFALVFIILGGLTFAQNEAMNDVIRSRQQKLDRIKFEIDSLKREATKVSKDDVMALAQLEQERFLWARRLEKLAPDLKIDAYPTPALRHHVGHPVQQQAANFGDGDRHLGGQLPGPAPGRMAVGQGTSI